MEKVILKIGGMSCSHCANRIQEVLKNIENIKEVQVDLDSGTAIVFFEGDLDLDTIRSLIEEEGYQLLGVE